MTYAGVLQGKMQRTVESSSFFRTSRGAELMESLQQSGLADWAWSPLVNVVDVFCHKS
jgi:hypothetical protein